MSAAAKKELALLSADIQTCDHQLDQVKDAAKDLKAHHSDSLKAATTHLRRLDGELGAQYLDDLKDHQLASALCD